ncbi:unnamed protein product [Gulo gulo]|uniref:Uncharacterized protein n=1 Tax=Gulo gulo TaxID=48420 RepID=A0A9X9LNS2_GULGU|nr:unnamed protein product [Gulo gulo]
MTQTPLLLPVTPESQPPSPARPVRALCTVMETRT